MLIDPPTIATYRDTGVVILKGAFKPWVEPVRAAIDLHTVNPGPYYSLHSCPGMEHGFFEDYLNWRRFPQYEAFLRDSPLGSIAVQLMSSGSSCQLLYDHVFVKEAGSSARTPWHQDSSYLPIRGTDLMTAWIPLDPIPADLSLQFILGSHHNGEILAPRSFSTAEKADPLLPDAPCLQSVMSRSTPIGFSVLPGDAVLFDSGVIHGTAETRPHPCRRRVFAARLFGADARFTSRPSIPPHPWSSTLQDGDRLPEDIFPLLATTATTRRSAWLTHHG